jgi:hypothetical protein
MSRARQVMFPVLLALLCLSAWVASPHADPAECSASCGGESKVTCECGGAGASCDAVDRDAANGQRGYCAATSEGCTDNKQCPPLIE